MAQQFHVNVKTFQDTIYVVLSSDIMSQTTTDLTSYSLRTLLSTQLSTASHLSCGPLKEDLARSVLSTGAIMFLFILFILIF